MAQRPAQSLPGSPDTTLLHDARAGDLQAYRQLVERNQGEVFSLALHLTGRHADATDLAHDAFIQLHAALPRITSPAHLRHWLAREIVQRAWEQGWQKQDDCATVAADPGGEFTTRVMAGVELRWSHRRPDFVPAGARRRKSRRGRALLAGAVAFVILAAMSLMWWPGDPRQPSATAVDTGTAAIVESPQSPATPGPAAAAAPSAASSGPAAARDANAHPAIIVLPVRHASPDANAVAPVEIFHAALLAELRSDPNLVLLVPGTTAPPDSQHPADYLFMVTSLETRALASGGAAIVTDGRSGSLSAGTAGPGRWPVEIRIQPLRDLPSAGYVSTLQIGEDQTQLAQLAMRQAQQLRAQMFPDTSLKQQLLGRFRDAALPATERNRAMQTLLTAQSGRRLALTPIDVNIISTGVATLPADERAQLWRNLRGVAHPDLADTLVDALRDQDLQVRFEALATLAADYRDEPQVRAAIESVARQDNEQAMRMAARRVLSGESQWRSYVLRSLQDTTLPAAGRVSPLLLAARSATTAAETLALRNLVNDREISDQLDAVIRDGWFDYTQAGAIGDALALQAGQGIPAMRQLLVEMPQEPNRPASSPEIAPAGPSALPASQVPPAVMAWLQNNRSNPLARRTLDDISRGSVNPLQLVQIERIVQMQRRQPPRR